MEEEDLEKRFKALQLGLDELRQEVKERFKKVEELPKEKEPVEQRKEDVKETQTEQPPKHPGYSLLEGDPKPLILEVERVLDFMTRSDFEGLNELGFKMIFISKLQSSDLVIHSEYLVKKMDGSDGFIDLLIETKDKKKAALLELKYVPIGFVKDRIGFPGFCDYQTMFQFFEDQKQLLQQKKELGDVMVQVMANGSKQHRTVTKHCQDAYVQAKIYWRDPSIKKHVPLNNVFAVVGVGHRVAIYGEKEYKRDSQL
jgi:hypothetical protein